MKTIRNILSGLFGVNVHGRIQQENELIRQAMETRRLARVYGLLA